ncbi:MAG: hypothetical protein JNM04_07840 [Chthonomonas sp.]|nr:hypothetical protein [Chthonomonas sp.]
MAKSDQCLVLLCDVVDYSRLDPMEQVQVVKLIWESVLRNDGALYNVHAKDATLWGTGDGLYLTTTNTSIDSKLALCYLCKSMIKAVQITGRNLRAGLHEGLVNRVPVRRGKYQMSGPALNECARIIPYAADGQVVVSEEFARSIIDSPRSDAQRIKYQLNPHPDKGAFRATVKHGVVMSVRFDSSEDSHRVTNLSMCGQAIDLELFDIAEWIRDHRLKMSGEELGLRITIFRPERNEHGKVHCFTGTPFRFDSRAASPNIDFSRSIYPVDPAQGIAIAFVDRAPRHVAGLPDHTVDGAEYYRQVEDRWNVPELVAREWSTKS